jgi:hypothetical protein
MQVGRREEPQHHCNMSFNSRRIVQERARTGQYVPIQYRTSQLLKAKQEKIEKRQREKELSQIIE